MRPERHRRENPYRRPERHQADEEWQLSADAAYVHYCPNETIDGVAIDETPDFGDKVVIGDYSSTILSRPLDVSRFGVIYAGAQKISARPV